MDKNDRIEQILGVTKKLDRATPPPFLLTRIEAAIDSARTRARSLTVRPAKAFALLGCMALLIFANIEVLSTDSKPAADQPIHHVTSDYSLTGNLELY